MDELSKIDEIRSRFDISYKEASDALAEAGGDLVAALINLEAKKSVDEDCENCGKGSEMWEKVKKQFEDTNRKKIVISKEGKTVVNIPATFGAVGVLGVLFSAELAVIAGVGAIAALASDYKFKIDSGEEEKEDNLNDD